jgi:hypothetical protein
MEFLVLGPLDLVVAGAPVNLTALSQAGFRGDLDPRMICPGGRRFSGDGIYFEAVSRGTT